MEEKKFQKIETNKKRKNEKKNVKMQFGLCYSTCITDTK